MSGLSSPNASENVSGSTKYATNAEATAGVINNKALVPSNPIPAQNLVGTIPPSLTTNALNSIGSYAFLYANNAPSGTYAQGTTFNGSLTVYAGIAGTSSDGDVGDNGIQRGGLPLPSGTWRLHGFGVTVTNTSRKFASIAQRIL